MELDIKKFWDFFPSPFLHSLEYFAHWTKIYWGFSFDLESDTFALLQLLLVRLTILSLDMWKDSVNLQLLSRVLFTFSAFDFISRPSKATRVTKICHFCKFSKVKLNSVFKSILRGQSEKGKPKQAQFNLIMASIQENLNSNFALNGWLHLIIYLSLLWILNLTVKLRPELNQMSKRMKSFLWLY